MATAEQLASCTGALLGTLKAHGFNVSDRFDEKAWQAVAVVAGSNIADRLAGKVAPPSGVDPTKYRYQTCLALQKTLLSLPPGKLKEFAFDQKRRLSPPGPAPGTFASKFDTASVVGLVLGTAAFGTGLFLTFRKA
jgi:hypothetical protein